MQVSRLARHMTSVMTLASALYAAESIDWQHVRVWYHAPEAGFSTIKLTNTAEHLLLYIEAAVPWTAHTVIFIDTDARPDTGFHGGWMTHGYDVLCDAWNVYAYAGGGVDWTWTNIGTYTYATLGTARELRVPRAWLGTGLMIHVLGRTSPPETFIPAQETDVVAYDWIGAPAQGAATPGAGAAAGARAVEPDTGGLPPVRPSARRHEHLSRILQARGWRPLTSAHADGMLVFSNAGVYMRGALGVPLAFGVQSWLAGDTHARRAWRAQIRTQRTAAGCAYWARYVLPPLTCDVMLVTVPDGVRIGMLVRAGAECAARVGWALAPLPAGVVWHDDVRRARGMNMGEQYDNGRATGVGVVGRHSRYPWAVIGDAARGCAVLVDVSEPVFHLISADGRMLQCNFDAAFSTATPAAPLCAAWESIVCRVPASNAWRATVARYYATYPAWTNLHGPRRDGLWLPFVNPQTIARPEDFGFAAHEYLQADPAYNAAHGIGSFFYHEPTLAWWPMRAGTPRTQAVLAEQLMRASREGNVLAATILADGQRDPAGALVADFLTMPWNDGARVRMAPLPPARAPAPARAAYAAYLWSQCSNQLARPAVSGLYLDSMNANTAFTYAPAQLARCPGHASVAVGSRTPGVHGCVALFAWCEYLAAQVWPRGLQLMGNFPFAAVPFLARFIDVPGEETTWYEGGVYRPMALAELDYLRAMCGAKSYLFLQCCDFDGFAPYVERYLARCGAYGFFPSMFSHNSADKPYWETPQWYERDRALFARYVPVIAAMARAGWRPEPAAWCDAPVVCEQFGAPEDARGWWISLYNPDAHIAAGYVHLQPAARWVALQPLTGAVMPAEEDGRLPFAVGPEAWLPMMIVQATPTAVRETGAACPVVTALVDRAAAFVSSPARPVPPPVRIDSRCHEPALVTTRVATAAGDLMLGATAVCPPLTATLPVTTVTTYRAQSFVPVELRFYTAGVAELTWQAAGMSVTQRISATTAGVTQMHCTVAGNATDTPVEIAVCRDGWSWHGTALVVRLPGGANLLRASDVRCSVDSCYPGYTSAPLRDGITATDGLHWAVAAWASAEHGGAHWIDLQFPEPTQVCTVRIYWAVENGVAFTARALEVWGAATGEPLRRLRRVEPARAEEMTEVALPAEPLMRLRLVQPDGLGAAVRPHLMWVREVEVAGREGGKRRKTGNGRMSKDSVTREGI